MLSPPSFEFALSRRQHGSKSGWGRQSYQSVTRWIFGLSSAFLPLSFWKLNSLQSRRPMLGSSTSAQPQTPIPASSMPRKTKPRPAASPAERHPAIRANRLHPDRAIGSCPPTVLMVEPRRQLMKHREWLRVERLTGKSRGSGINRRLGRGQWQCPVSIKGPDDRGDRNLVSDQPSLKLRKPTHQARNFEIERLFRAVRRHDPLRPAVYRRQKITSPSGESQRSRRCSRNPLARSSAANSGVSAILYSFVPR